MKRPLALALCLAVLAPASAAFADPTIKDAKIGVYARYDAANLRVDKIETVRHIDGNPLVADVDGADGNGYVILTLSVQNASKAEIFMPPFVVSLFLEDGSKVDGGTPLGPFVGAKTAPAPDRLEPKETDHIRLVITGWPGTRITKIVLDPASATGSPLRVQVGPNDVLPLPEVPRARPTDGS